MVRGIQEAFTKLAWMEKRKCFPLIPQRVPLSEEEIQKKRDEAERKARRGEIDPMHDYVFQVICQVSGEWGEGAR